MKPPSPTSGTPGQPAAPAGVKSPAWTTGQLLQATVGRSEAGRVLLQIGHRQVMAETSLPLQPGQRIDLRVQETGRLPVLRILSALTEDDPAAAAVRQLLPRQAPLAPLLGTLAALARQSHPALPAAVDAAVRGLGAGLPDTRQVSTAAGLKAALRNSGLFLEPRLLADPGRPPPAADFKAGLLRLLQALRASPPAATRPAAAPAGAAAPAAAGRAGATAGTERPAADPPRLRANPLPLQVLARLQHRMVQPPLRAVAPPLPMTPATAGRTNGIRPPASPPPPPLPGQPPRPQAVAARDVERLLRLGTLRTELLQQAEAALARLHLSQLAATPREGDRSLIEWLFDLPVRRGDAIDLWSLRVTRDNGRPRAGGRRQRAVWTVQLAFDLPGLGPMQAQVQLHGDTVSARFRAERASTVPLVQDHLHELRRTLQETGLEVGDIDCHCGSLPAADTAGTGPLIDEQA